VGRALVLVWIAGCYDPSAALDDAGTTGDGPIDGCVSDDFNADLDDRWMSVTENQATTASAFQDLELELPVAGLSRAKLTTANKFDVTDAEVRVELVQPPRLDVGAAVAFRLSLQDPTATETFEFRRNDDTRLTILSNGSMVDAGPYDPTLHRHLRIRHAGTNIHYETSPTREIWTAVVGSPVSVTAQLTEASAVLELGGTVTNPAIAAFDNFEVVSSGCDGRASPPIVLDTFGGGGIVSLASHPSDSGAAWEQTAGSSIALVTGGRVAHDNTPPELRYLASIAPVMADYDVEADAIPVTTNRAAVVAISARGTSEMDGGYLFSIDHLADGTFTPTMTRIAKGIPTDLPCDSSLFTSVLGRRYRLRLRVRGSSITGWIDGFRVCAATDSTFEAPGKAGLRFVGAGDATEGLHVDNFLVTAADQ
jgi:hypothetical protein